MATAANRDSWKTMHDLMWEGEAHDRMHRACATVNLSPGVLKGLVHLVADEGKPMRELAEHFGCDASWVTTLTDELEKHGLAERRPHRTDRRVKEIVLTAKGVKAKQRALDVMYEPPACFDALNPADQRTLRDLLAKVAAADPALAAIDGAGGKASA